MTIKEFARTIGVSPTTVSHSLHDRGRVSSVTRTMVKERMVELGFVPNVNGQRLSHGRSNMVALSFGDTHDYLADMFLVELTRGLQDELEARGYGLLLSGPGEPLMRWVNTRAVDSVLLFEPTDRDAIRQMALRGTPCIVIETHRTDPIPGVGSVNYSLEKGARLVARHLFAQGHRKIGYLISGKPEDVFYCFSDELNRLGAPLSSAYVIHAGLTPRDGASALQKLLSQDDPPTAVFARTDGLAAGVLSAAHRMGVRIPHDLSVVGHDDVPFAELVEPPLTTVRIDCHELGKLAAETLFSLLDQPGAEVDPRVLDTRLIFRDSVSIPRQHALSIRQGRGKEVGYQSY